MSDETRPEASSGAAEDDTSSLPVRGDGGPEDLPTAGDHDQDADTLAGDLTDPDIDLTYEDAKDEDGGDA